MNKKKTIAGVCLMLFLLESCSGEIDSNNSSFSNVEKETLNFSNLYDFASDLTVADIDKISISSGNYSTQPPWLNSVNIYANENYFEQVIQFFHKATLTPCYDPYIGIDFYDAGISTAEDTFSLSFTSEDEFYIGNNVYKCSDSFPASSPNSSYSYYATPSDEDIVFDSFGNTLQLSNSYLQSLKFTMTSQESTFFDFTKDATIRLDKDLCLRIQDSRNFYIEDRAYSLVSEADFSSLISGIHDTTSMVNIRLEPADSSVNFKVSNDIEYSYDELLEISQAKIGGQGEYKLVTNEDELYETGPINSDLNLKLIEIIENKN